MKFCFAFLTLFVFFGVFAAEETTYKLVLTEEFNGNKLNKKLWKRIDQGAPDWKKNMSTREDLVTLKNGILSAWGVKNDDLSADPRACLTGGISSEGNFAIKYGKIEVRCKLNAQKGAWPAIWMLPDLPNRKWPDDGEIDILERLNFDPFIYQTVHSSWTQRNPGNPPKGGTAAISNGEWHVFAIEWTPEKIVWLVDGKATHSYAKTDADASQWPWHTPFYLLIDMQLGGSWVGSINLETLPTVMEVDWVKWYGAWRGKKEISEYFVNGKQKKLKPKKR